MDGQEHYQAGEEAINLAMGPNMDLVRSQIYMTLAVAHFTAASAAATALAAGSRF
jgi:hypothetical protein